MIIHNLDSGQIQLSGVIICILCVFVLFVCLIWSDYLHSLCFCVRLYHFYVFVRIVFVYIYSVWLYLCYLYLLKTPCRVTQPPSILGYAVSGTAFVGGLRLDVNSRSELRVLRFSFVCVVLCCFLAVLCCSRLQVLSLTDRRKLSVKGTTNDHNTSMNQPWNTSTSI